MKKLFLILVLGITFSTCSEQKLIHSLVVKKNKIIIEPARSLAAYFTAPFFVQYENDIDLSQFHYSIQILPFLLNVLTLAWASGNTYYVEAMDKDLYECLDALKEVFKYMYPRTRWNGQVLAKKLVLHDPGQAVDGIAIPFSGGIDSTASSLAHRDKKQLLITAWGHSDLPLESTALWLERKRKTAQYAHFFGHQISALRSNYFSFLNLEALAKLSPEISRWRLSAVEGLGWVGLTLPILLTKGYHTLCLPSSHTWLYTYPSASNPYVDENIRCCSLKIMHDQFDLTRLAKIKLICDTYETTQLKPFYLRVCNKNKADDTNCHKCRKCVCTTIGFYVLNKDPHPFGLKKSLKRTVKESLKLLEPTELNWYTILYFKEIQNHLKTQISKNLPVDAELLPLLQINLEKKIAFDIDDKRQLNWQEMHHLLPSIIPSQMETL